MRRRHITDFERFKQLKDELFVKNKPLTERDFWVKILEYRDLNIKLYGYDPCASKNASKEELEVAESTMSRMKELVEDYKNDETFSQVLRLIFFKF